MALFAQKSTKKSKIMIKHFYGCNFAVSGPLLLRFCTDFHPASLFWFLEFAVCYQHAIDSIQTRYPPLMLSWHSCSEFFSITQNIWKHLLSCCNFLPQMLLCAIDSMLVAYNKPPKPKEESRMKFPAKSEHQRTRNTKVRAILVSYFFRLIFDQNRSKRVTS